jgi:hypothetical protein
MSIELMLDTANLAFVDFPRTWGHPDGQLFVLMVIVASAAAAARRARQRDRPGAPRAAGDPSRTWQSWGKESPDPVRARTLRRAGPASGSGGDSKGMTAMPFGALEDGSAENVLRTAAARMAGARLEDGADDPRPVQGRRRRSATVRETALRSATEIWSRMTDGVQLYMPSLGRAPMGLVHMASRRPQSRK